MVLSSLWWITQTSHLQTWLTSDSNTTVYGVGFQGCARQLRGKLQISLVAMISQSITGRDSKVFLPHIYSLKCAFRPRPANQTSSQFIQPRVFIWQAFVFVCVFECDSILLCLVWQPSSDWEIDLMWTFLEQQTQPEKKSQGQKVNFSYHLSFSWYYMCTTRPLYILHLSNTCTVLLHLFPILEWQFEPWASDSEPSPEDPAI